MSRIRYSLLIGVVLLVLTAAVGLRRPDPDRQLAAAMSALDHRAMKGRFARPYPHKRYRRSSTATSADKWLAATLFHRASRDARDAHFRRRSGAALLLGGRADDAFATFVDLLRQQTEETDVLPLIHASNDAALLTDFSAAALERADDRDLLLAYEAADRAWQLSRSIPASWNRALAADRIGMYAFAERAWREIRAREPDPDWAREAEERRVESARRANAPPPAALELFFYRDLFTRTLAGEAPADVIPTDRLASDTSIAIARLRAPAARQRLYRALATYLRGYEAVERSEIAVASGAYATAEAELDALNVPLAWIAHDQRIRCDCVLRKPRCLEAMRSFQSEVASANRYPWLAARVVHGEGQTLYRQGRMYEAAQRLEHALSEFEKLGDGTSAAQMHILLTNVYGAGGESELALRHYLQGITVRTPPDIVDRRRKMLEDGIVFMLRHNYLGAAELLLDELDTAAVTDAAHVYRATLRGVAAYRRGDARRASQLFTEAHMLLRALPDATTRTDLGFRLAIAEAGTHMQPMNSILADLNAGVAVQSGTEHSIWLPQLLTARGAAFESANELDRAEADYRRAIEVLESREPRIDQTVLALGLPAPSESPFDRALRLLMRQGRIVDALSIADRASALRISSLHAHSAGVRDVFRPLRETGDGIAEARRALRPGEVAVTHYLLHDELIVWVIAKDSVRAVRHPVRREAIARDVQRLRVDALSAALLHPWIELVPRGATLLLQSAAELDSVPFAMLETRDGERLVERNPSSNIPKLRAVAQAATQDAERAGKLSVFLAAAPRPGLELDPLPRAAPEVINAAKFYASATIEPSAMRAMFLAQASEYSIVHFAGHIVVDPVRPLFSALAFDGGELLYVHELDEHSFAKTRLIVLSACDSGRTPRPAMSIANALLSQKVPSVVYTYRAVDDEVAEAFALELHRALGRGISRAEAVREAQLAVMRARPDDPTAWAAFALAGAAGPMAESETEKEEE